MKQFALAALLVSVAACSSSTPESSKPASSTPAAAPATPASTTPRVFFIEPKDGATVKSPVHLKFGTENFMIMAVPPDPVTDVRKDMGHYHVGVEQDCLPAGTEIVKGTPSWVHFGKGDDQMDLQLTPGQHKLALQIGDDKHVTMTGLCQQITITVTE